LIAPQVLTKLHGRFLFPLSGLSYKQSVSRGDCHSADLVGAYWRNMKMRNKRPTLSNHKKCLQVVVGVSEFVYMRDLVSLIRDIPIFGDILSLQHLELRSRLFFNIISKFFAIRHVANNQRGCCWCILSPLSLNLQQNTHQVCLCVFI
jgi:hypothetical protein